MTNPIWLCDSHCVLCDGAVRFTLRHEKASLIRFVSIQSPKGRALAKKHGLDPDNPESFIFLEGGNALKQSGAALTLLSHLKGPIRAFRLARFLPKRFRDFLYRLIARHRYRLFGRMSQCTLPDPALAERFIS